ncbi:MAG TPA: DUF2934 domain-containing protein [Steroidobacteraceae bacterium]|nr:DUF2934 domain-containing protein [Steroidobacteraceae bacterium]
MATRRVPDSQQRSRKSPTDPQAVAATPAVQSAVHSALDGSGAPDPASAAKAKKRRAGTRNEQAVIAATPTPTVSADERRGMIAYSAYLRAERRGFSPEGQAEDWLAAEKEVDALLNSGHTAPQ